MDIIIDKSKEKAYTHDYIELKKPVKAAYIKIESIYSAKNGKFALSDLRIFGEGNGKTPELSGRIFRFCEIRKMTVMQL